MKKIERKYRRQKKTTEKENDVEILKNVVKNNKSKIKITDFVKKKGQILKNKIYQF